MAVHLINDPFETVNEMLRGVVAASPESIALTAGGRGVSTRTPTPGRRVSVIIGGGSGHESAFLGWVGPGFADGCAVGNVFASPSADPVVELVEALDHPAGALFLFGNYEGDIMNFAMASATLTDNGRRVRTVLLTDDVASAPPERASRRRGVAGGVIVVKIVGAYADTGADLDDVAAMARHANAQTRTIGLALSPCHLPTAARPSFELRPGEVDFGIGVHGEAGLSRRALADANTMVDALVDAILTDLPVSAACSSAVVMVNTFGATPLMEGFIALARARQRVTEAGFTVRFAHAGNYLTSLQMAGLSVTVTLLDQATEPLFAGPGAPLYLPPLGGSR